MAMFPVSIQGGSTTFQRTCMNATRIDIGGKILFERGLRFKLPDSTAGAFSFQHQTHTDTDDLEKGETIREKVQKTSVFKT